MNLSRDLLSTRAIAAHASVPRMIGSSASRRTSFGTIWGRHSGVRLPDRLDRLKSGGDGTRRPRRHAPGPELLTHSTSQLLMSAVKPRGGRSKRRGSGPTRSRLLPSRDGTTYPIGKSCENPASRDVLVLFIGVGWGWAALRPKMKKPSVSRGFVQISTLPATTGHESDSTRRLPQTCPGRRWDGVARCLFASALAWEFPRDFALLLVASSGGESS